MTRVHHVLTGQYRPHNVERDEIGVYTDDPQGGGRQYLTVWREEEREVTIHFGNRIITYKRP